MKRKKSEQFPTDDKLQELNKHCHLKFASVFAYFGVSDAF